MSVEIFIDTKYVTNVTSPPILYALWVPLSGRGQTTRFPDYLHISLRRVILDTMDTFFLDLDISYDDTAPGVIVISYNKNDGWWVFAWYDKYNISEHTQHYHQCFGFPLTHFIPLSSK